MRTPSLFVNDPEAGTSIKRPAVILSQALFNGRTSVFQTNTQVSIPPARPTYRRFGRPPATTPALAHPQTDAKPGLGERPEAKLQIVTYASNADGSADSRECVQHRLAEPLDHEARAYHRWLTC